MKDCSLTKPDGTDYAFSFTDISKAIKYAFEHDIAYIKTPYGVLSLIDNDTYQSVMYYNGMEMTDEKV